MNTAFLSFKQSMAVAMLSLSAVSGAQAAGDWQTTLQSRDINGDGKIDAYYDTSLNVTWLANLTAAIQESYTHGSSSPWSYSMLDWNGANSWAKNLNVEGVTGWRLPSMVDLGSKGCVQGQPDCGSANLDVSRSELAHMYYTTLGNAAYPQAANMGPFKRELGIKDMVSSLRSNVFWLSEGNWAFNTLNGEQFQYSEFAPIFSAWAVHSGDVPNVTNVPEAGTFGLMALGLAAVAGAARSKRR
ncbi:MAG: hypothetical protein C0487_04620 [Leptothrix sp. (in: Bacteria)]|nr:hypothetical protein [Leptothrix sp. (in: b-proteobacteria)]